MVPNAWIFQANPKVYSLRQALENLQELGWVVRQHENDIGVDDKVYLWEGGASAGIVAVGRVLSDPSRMKDTEEEKKYYCGNPPKNFQGKQLRVRILLERVLAETLGKETLKADDVLKNLKIVNMPRETNYYVSAPQVARLDKLISTLE